MSENEQNPSVTRGDGLLEPWLARKRAEKANALIPDHLRGGRILDVGCGSYPYFLTHTYFKAKFAADQQSNRSGRLKIAWSQIDLNTEPSLPYEEGFFNAVTMLAVVEHLRPASTVQLFDEAYRVLAPGGRFVLTTPAAWSNGLLHLMARLGLVSKEEIHEHVCVYSLPLLGQLLVRAGFTMDKVQLGYFEFGLNLWAAAER